MLLAVIEILSVSSLRQHYLDQVQTVVPMHRDLSAWLPQAPAGTLRIQLVTEA
jgi:hypothetical protein